jgi:hypothetical protein
MKSNNSNIVDKKNKVSIKEVEDEVKSEINESIISNIELELLSNEDDITILEDNDNTLEDNDTSQDQSDTVFLKNDPKNISIIDKLQQDLKD